MNEPDLKPFDWDRMFLGDLPPLYLLELVFRTTVLYLFAFGMYRLVGKRALGQLSPFELLVVVALGTGLGDPILTPDTPITHGMTVITTLCLVARGMAFLKSRSSRLEGLMESSPKLVVSSGRILVDTLRRERIASDEILMKLREVGVENLGEVREAYLETAGTVSVFRWKDGQTRSGLLLIPPPENQVPGSTMHVTMSAACAECGCPLVRTVRERWPVCGVCGSHTYGVLAPVDPLFARPSEQ